MAKEKIEVVELNKKEEQIIIEEHKNYWSSFWKQNGKSLFILTLVLSFSSFIIGFFITLRNMYEITEPNIKEAYVDTQFSFNTSEITLDTMTPITDETAKNTFLNNQLFKNNGEIFIKKIVEAGTYTIRYYSDGTALKIIKSTNFITRIAPLSSGGYGIQDDGTINAEAKISDISVKNTKTYSWGTATHYSDGSAEITNSNFNMYVRNGSDIVDDYISINKVAYFEKTTKVGSITLNYYYDGTIEVKKDETYVVRNPEDIKITSNDVTFPNKNEAVIINTKTLADNKKIYYYSDGSAIIKDGTRSISVRKSNGIIIKDNLIYEIINNIYVDVTKNISTGNITYYSNGSAIIEYNNKILYIPDNSLIKYSGSTITNIGTVHEEKTNKRTVNGHTITTFNTMALVENPQYKAIVNKDNILYDTDGGLKEILTNLIKYDDKTFTITNNSNDTINYRIVIEKSSKTTLDDRYIKYQLSVKDTYIAPKFMNSNIWGQDDFAEVLNMTGTNYILTDSTLEPFATTNIKLMLWTDYDTIPNTMQDKYFYGTIKIYAWIEEESNL